MKLQNLHNHSLFSDGACLPEEVISAAVSGGLEMVGISDHFYTTKVYSDQSYLQWYEEFWHRYVYSLSCLKEFYSNQIKVVAGIEIDSCLYRTVGSFDRLPWKEINEGLDYVLIEYVGEVSAGGSPPDSLAFIRKLCSLPVIIAHPDLDYLQKKFKLTDFFQIMKSNDIALEIPSGRRNTWFWNRYDSSLLEGLKLSIGTDTHSDIEEVCNIGQALEFLEDNNLLDQLIQIE
ncbi:MAG: PHP domain-containing protein [Candidatus Rifleibacteriota bacterium]